MNIGYNKKKLIHFEEIGEQIFLLDISNTDYISKNGNVYRKYNNKYLKLTPCINSYNRYVYIKINLKDNKRKSKRLHRLIALTFIENPNKNIYTIVGHKNNIKTDNRIENLYWTTTQENTQKAVNDKLLINDTGFKDSQSTPIKVLNHNNEILATYGSMREACRYIKNLDLGYLSKITKKKGNYKPRNKKYKYVKISKEEFDKYDNSLKHLSLEENKPSNKNPKRFIATNILTGQTIISDNQKKFAKEHDLQQAEISNALRTGYKIPNWNFELLGECTYKESSLYDNFINTQNGITIKNIKNNELLYFKTKLDLKKYFNLKGNNIMQYYRNNQLIFSEWKIVSI